MLLESLDLPDLTELRDPKTRPKGQPGHVPGEVPVPGFVCASDPNAIAGRLPAPVSYRAATGDTYRGDNGAFAPGRSWSLAAIEERDGLSYTAAFSERLVGSGGEASGPCRATGSSRPPCPTAVVPRRSATAGWRNDAGSSWIASRLSLHPLQSRPAPQWPPVLHRRRWPYRLHGRVERTRPRHQPPPARRLGDPDRALDRARRSGANSPRSRKLRKSEQTA